MNQTAYPVSATQYMLRELSKSGQELPLLIPSGVNDAETQEAVRCFQCRNHLPETGEVDADTWRKLRSESQLARIQSGQAAPLNIVLQPNQVIRPGEQNAHLYLIQAMFHALSGCLDGVPAVSVTGQLDSETQEAVNWLRRCTGQEETGEIDHLLWFYLTLLYRALLGDGT